VSVVWRRKEIFGADQNAAYVQYCTVLTIKGDDIVKKIFAVWGDEEQGNPEGRS
jgi:hypothetical protein